MLNGSPILNLKPGDQAQLNIQQISGAALTKISWTPAEGLSCTDCLNPVLTATKNTVYRLEVEDENGCIAVFEIRVNIEDDLSIYFPTAFSPNGDGINESFGPIGKDLQIEYFAIYNRWGEQVHYATFSKP